MYYIYSHSNYASANKPKTNKPNDILAMKTTRLIAYTFALSLSGQALGETSSLVIEEKIAIPIGQQNQAQALKLPARGLTRQQVLEQFGVPKFWQDNVGTPPITHWRYANYSTYFEHNRVIHSVVHSKQNKTAAKAGANSERSSSSAHSSVSVTTKQELSSQAPDQEVTPAIEAELDVSEMQSQP